MNKSEKAISILEVDMENKKKSAGKFQNPGCFKRAP